jgi:hypothetical protein
VIVFLELNHNDVSVDKVTNEIHSIIRTGPAAMAGGVNEAKWHPNV